MGRFSGCVALLLTGFVASPLPGTEAFYAIPVEELTITDGTLPREGSASRRWRRQLVEFMAPYAVLDDGGEAVVGYRPPEWRDPHFRALTLHLRVPDGRKTQGRLFLPRAEGDGMVAVRFEVAPNTPPGESNTFYTAQRDHYRRLWSRSLPGSAAFRHHMTVAAELGTEEPGNPTPQGPTGVENPRRTHLPPTYELFSGGRAVSENLQLDRTLRPGPESGAKEGLVDLETVPGITIEAIPWEDRIAGKNPALDPLARVIPADQHALFFPGFRDFASFTEEAARVGTPLLRILETRSEDARTKNRYERQLCLSLDGIAGAFAPSFIKSVALTGSDPYLRTGSDVALLFETDRTDAVHVWVRSRQTATQHAASDARPIEGGVVDVPYIGVRTPDRSISSYLLTLPGVVVVANSPHALERIVRAATGAEPSLATLPEVVFFRSRYPRGDDAETAFLILTDATIRRWCGPRWRIGASRRTQAAAHLAELQARHQATLARGRVERKVLSAEDTGFDLGELTLSEVGVTSTVYGTLEYLTPIAELPLRRVTQSEVEAYQAFRQNYQRNWSRYFDPIAVRFLRRPAGLGVDVTVMPLIAGSDYRQLIDVTSGTTLKPQAGDPHAEALLHVTLALNPQSSTVEQGGRFLGGMMGRLGIQPLAWLGESVALYVDRDPIFNELADAPDAETFLARSWGRLPVAFHAEVKDPLILSAFLTSLRAFIEQSSPGLVAWTNLEHEGAPYVRVSAAHAVSEDLPDASVYYAVNPRFLVVSLREDVVRRALDRAAGRSDATRGGDAVADSGRTWLGEQVGLWASGNVLRVLSHVLRNEWENSLQLRSWGNLPILNEWRRRFPSEDPIRLHERVWKTRLVCPGRGRYVWNETYQTMESTAFGCPAVPKSGPRDWTLIEGVEELESGLTFEDNGLRARLEWRRKSAETPRPGAKKTGRAQ